MLNNPFEIFTDGGSRGNPGPSACAFVINHEVRQGFYLGNGTNNNAEYFGLLKAYEYLNQYVAPNSNLHFYLDSELVVKQMKGEYRVKDPNILNLYHQIKNYERKYQVKYTHVPRELNQEADQLVNQVLDQYT